MASSPRWKCYRDGKYVAACKYLEDAAAIIANGGEIRDGHSPGRVVFRDGQDGISAADSYDAVAQFVIRGLACQPPPRDQI